MWRSVPVDRESVRFRPVRRKGPGAPQPKGLGMAPTVALITGAGRGMGQLAAWRLAAAGAQVAAVDLNEAGLAETTGAHSRIRAYPGDVTDVGAIEQLV